ncbi:hypothetical protein HELRODRAFT_187766 [Helobdella robusta]|uniref:E2F/DP family winged-helix DNA-binding domain-containing protein n=1 Tax=Helobdella robusta TaxID=6412 RepID=T1FPD0_HELRO|nr:hypothetical protein HELRODRAFT_187766 [Helobdella robusta]ESO11966.1 hypothetical protein HELRODRAFT_187766 [Helobdella robusta]
MKLGDSSQNISENEPGDFTPGTPHHQQKHRELVDQTPWTPTSNFKLLLKALSPDIRIKDQLLLAGRDCSADSQFFDGKENSPEMKKEETTSKVKFVGRKEKSLGVLCQRFLKKYPPYLPSDSYMEVCLKEAAEYLGVGRRRVYDIINVMEAIDLTKRLAKNRYLWIGKNKLSKTISEFKVLALQEGMDKKMEKFQSLEMLTSMSKSRSSGSMEASFIKSSSSNSAASEDTRKSLSFLSRKFLMMFLVSKDNKLYLETGARMLLDDMDIDKSDVSKFKTMIRRLYDIANIMSTLELIKKVHMSELKGRKPLYVYIGPSALLHSDVIDKAPAPHTPNRVPQQQQRRPAMQRHLNFDVICEAASFARNSLNGDASHGSVESVVSESCSNESDDTKVADEEEDFTASSDISSPDNDHVMGPKRFSFTSPMKLECSEEVVSGRTPQVSPSFSDGTNNDSIEADDEPDNKLVQSNVDRHFVSRNLTDATTPSSSTPKSPKKLSVITLLHFKPSKGICSSYSFRGIKFVPNSAGMGGVSQMKSPLKRFHSSDHVAASVATVAARAVDESGVPKKVFRLVIKK